MNFFPPNSVHLNSTETHENLTNSKWLKKKKKWNVMLPSVTKQRNKSPRTYQKLPVLWPFWFVFCKAGHRKESYQQLHPLGRQDSQALTTSSQSWRTWVRTVSPRSCWGAGVRLSPLGSADQRHCSTWGMETCLWPTRTENKHNREGRFFPLCCADTKRVGGGNEEVWAAGL